MMEQKRWEVPGVVDDEEDSRAVVFSAVGINGITSAGWAEG